MKIAPLVALVALAAALVACGERHATIDVREAPTRTQAYTLTLTGGSIAFDKGGQYERLCASTANPTSKGSGACSNLYFYVFPVLSAGSTAPVGAWVTCAGNEKSAAECEAWGRAHSAEIRGSVAVRVGDGAKATRTASGWETAVDDATKRHGLTTPTGAPVLRLGRD